MTRVEKGREPRILVVDDEERILEAIHKLLEAEGYSVCTAGNGHEGLRLFFSWQPDLVLLDVRMPKMNGWDLLERIREMSETPVIMITVLGQENERVRGLESGADDYLPKPFGQAELVARVRAVLRRARVPSKSIEVYRDDVLMVDFLRHRVLVKDQEVGLTPLEFRVLSALVQHSRAVLTSDRLLSLCWNGKVGDPNNVRALISHLRKKIEKNPARPRLIETVREFGYRYCAPQDGAYRARL